MADDDDEEAGGSNRLLGFMFGNVDNSGDLDVDYLDEVTFILAFDVMFIFISPFSLLILIPPAELCSFVSCYCNKHQWA